MPEVKQEANQPVKREREGDEAALIDLTMD
jgi:hypothetical protein